MRLRTLTILAALAATLAGCGKYETWEFDNNCSGYLFTDHKFCEIYQSRLRPQPSSGRMTD